MALLVTVVVLLLLVYGPQYWARYVLARYDRHEYFSGTGMAFAHLLITALPLKGVRAEVSLSGDHYDPTEKRVGLSPRVAERRSLTAIVVVSHEVAHALQDASAYPPLVHRRRLLKLATAVEKAGYLVFLVFPLVGLLFRVPIMGVLTLVGAGVILLAPVLVHLITLPVELDASFRRALPLLISGPYIPPEDLPAARRILTACAVTYVAAALAGIFNVWRWARVLRR